MALDPKTNAAITLYVVKITHTSDAVMTMNLFLKIASYLAGFTILKYRLIAMSTIVYIEIFAREYFTMADK